MSENADASKTSKKELPPWRLPPGPPSESHVTVNIDSYYSKRGDRSGIASWDFDPEKNLYVIKRKSVRLEYYKSANDFSILTKLDLHQLNEAYFENKGRNGQARMFRTFLNEQCLTNFAKMKTDESTLKKAKGVKDPRTGKDCEQDIKVLARSQIRHEQLWEEQAKIFTVAVADIIRKKLYAGSGDHGEDINF
ncbi:hypothetical protein L1987_38125 [Smallanthus sonchifolius]|uniref:Uncharacterized protein n=1 Tax=Smallanthus sonchifolius TaxID=185202 RepID=A0ACB9HK35_9ASTR|nr:hypothetical protein L1987_38125 [Smallanthus sonchifolius]